MKIRSLIGAALCATSLLLTGCGGDDNNGTFVNQFPNQNQNPNQNPNPGGGNTVNGSNFNLTFTGDSNVRGGSQYTVTDQLDTATTGVLPSSAAPTRIDSTLTDTSITGVTALTRIIRLNIQDTNQILANDVFNFQNPVVAPGAFAEYQELGTPEFRRWVATGGDILINSIGANSVSVTFRNAQFTRSNEGQNTATGTLTINGPATLTFPTVP